MNMIRNMLLGFFIAVGSVGQAGAMQLVTSLVSVIPSALPLIQEAGARDINFNESHCLELLKEQRYKALSEMLYSCLDDQDPAHAALRFTVSEWMSRCLETSLDPLLLYMNARKVLGKPNHVDAEQYKRALTDFVLCVLLSDLSQEFLTGDARTVPDFSTFVKNKIESKYGATSFSAAIRTQINFVDVKTLAVDRLKKFALQKADDENYPLPYWLLHVTCGKPALFGWLTTWGFEWGDLTDRERFVRQQALTVEFITNGMRECLIRKIAALEKIETWHDFLQKSDMNSLVDDQQGKERIVAITEEINNLLQQQEEEQGNKKES